MAALLSAPDGPLVLKSKPITFCVPRGFKRQLKVTQCTQNNNQSPCYECLKQTPLSTLPLLPSSPGPPPPPLLAAFLRKLSARRSDTAIKRNEKTWAKKVTAIWLILIRIQIHTSPTAGDAIFITSHNTDDLEKTDSVIITFIFLSLRLCVCACACFSIHLLSENDKGLAASWALASISGAHIYADISSNINLSAASPVTYAEDKQHALVILSLLRRRKDLWKLRWASSSNLFIYIFLVSCNLCGHALRGQRAGPGFKYL